MRGGPALAFVSGLTIALSTVVAAACGGGGGSDKPIVAATATLYPPGPVGVESISPTRAALGARVTIHGSGFALDHNDVGFAHPSADPQGQHIGYLNDISSPDAKTLTFNLPDNQNVLLGACAFSQLPADAACPAIGILLRSGDTLVFVANKYGTSNGLTLTVTSP
jgi:hypothetical protein